MMKGVVVALMSNGLNLLEDANIFALRKNNAGRQDQQ